MRLQRVEEEGEEEKEAKKEEEKEVMVVGLRWRGGAGGIGGQAVL